MQCSREVFGEKSFEKLSTVVWYELFLLRTLDFIGRVFSVNTMGEETTFGVCRHRVFSLNTACVVCINIRKMLPFLHKYTIPDACVLAEKRSRAMFPQSGKASKMRFFDERKTPLQCLLDAIMLLTFFDAVVIAIATCSYRDSNMMLST